MLLKEVLVDIKRTKGPTPAAENHYASFSESNRLVDTLSLFCSTLYILVRPYEPTKLYLLLSQKWTSDQLSSVHVTFYSANTSTATLYVLTGG